MAVLESLLHDVVFDLFGRDSCKWDLDGNGIISIKSLPTLVEESVVSGGQVNATVQNNLVPKKINVFVYRALRGRRSVCVEFCNTSKFKVLAIYIKNSIMRC